MTFMSLIFKGYIRTDIPINFFKKLEVHIIYKSPISNL